MSIIVSISGKAESGKDMTASIIKEILEKKGKRACIIHYADYLKFICEKYLGWNGQKDEAGRSFLQHEGTDHIRSIDEDNLIEVAGNFINLYHHKFDYFLIPDTRFPRECDWFRYNPDVKHTSLRIVRLNHISSLTEAQLSHCSETALDSYVFDAVIESESGIENLEKKVSEWIDSILTPLERYGADNE